MNLNNLDVSIERIKDGVMVEVNPSPQTLGDIYSYKKHFDNWNKAISHIISVLENSKEDD